MSKPLILREGYKTLTVSEQSDGNTRISIHRPPHAWIDVVLTPQQCEQLYLELDRQHYLDSRWDA